MVVCPSPYVESFMRRSLSGAPLRDRLGREGCAQTRERRKRDSQASPTRLVQSSGGHFESQDNNTWDSRARHGPGLSRAANVSLRGGLPDPGPAKRARCEGACPDRVSAITDPDRHARTNADGDTASADVYSGTSAANTHRNTGACADDRALGTCYSPLATWRICGRRVLPGAQQA